MALSNRERIAHGMEHLRAGLVPFADEVIRTVTENATTLKFKSNSGFDVD
jgi:hypothetical protein